MTVSISKPPRGFAQWRCDANDRSEDAAYAFGFHLITHCRDEVLSTLPDDATPETLAAVEKAVDGALHNVCDMLEGFWRLEAGPRHSIALALHVEVQNEDGETVETQRISPCQHDLPIGYWKWAQDREFQ